MFYRNRVHGRRSSPNTEFMGLGINEGAIRVVTSGDPLKLLWTFYTIPCNASLILRIPFLYLHKKEIDVEVTIGS